MPCCCTNVWRLCDLVICDGPDLVLPIPIPTDGEYTLQLDFLSDVVEKRAMLSAGDNATFETSGLNERFTYVGHLKAPDGTTMTFTIDEVVYDCIEFTTKRSL